MAIYMHSVYIFSSVDTFPLNMFTGEHEFIEFLYESSIIFVFFFKYFLAWYLGKY